MAQFKNTTENNNGYSFGSYNANYNHQEFISPTHQNFRSRGESHNFQIDSSEYPNLRQDYEENRGGDNGSDGSDVDYYSQEVRYPEYYDETIEMTENHPSYPNSNNRYSYHNQQQHRHFSSIRRKKKQGVSIKKVLFVSLILITVCWFVYITNIHGTIATILNFVGNQRLNNQKIPNGKSDVALKGFNLQEELSHNYNVDYLKRHEQTEYDLGYSKKQEEKQYKTLKYDNMVKSVTKNIVKYLGSPVNDYLVQIVIEIENFGKKGKNELPNFQLQHTIVIEEIVGFYVKNFRNNHLSQSQLITLANKKSQSTIEEDLYVEGIIQLILNPQIDLKCCCKNNINQNECKPIQTIYQSNYNSNKEDFGLTNSIKKNKLIKSCWIDNVNHQVSTDNYETDESKLFLHIELFENQPSKAIQKQEIQQSFQFKIDPMQRQQNSVNCSIVLFLNSLDFEEN